MDLRFVKDPIVRAALMAADLFLRDIARNENLTTDLGSLGGASSAASFVTVSAESNLSAERRLIAGTALSLSDGGPNGTISLGATLVAPAIVLGTAAAAGVANNMIRSDATIVAFDATTPADLASTASTGVIALAARRDHVHRFPTSLLSTANLATLTFTDNGSDMQLEGTLGFLKLLMPNGYSFQVTGNPTTVVSIIGTPGSGTTTIMAPQWAAGNPNTTFRCWDAKPPGGGIWTTATFVGYDATATTITQSATSDTANKAYMFRGSGPVVAGTNGGYAELAGLFLEGIRRIVTSPATITATGGIILECPTIGTDQYGIWIKNRTAQVAGTNRYGIKIDEHNSGTNRWGAHISNRIHAQSPAAQALTVLDLRQLATGAAAGAHINFDDKAGNPPSPNAGDLWRNGTSLNYRKDGATTVDLLAAAGGGDSISVNGVAVTDADFDNITPDPPDFDSPYEGLNVRWQRTGASPDDISAYIGLDKNGNEILGFQHVASAVDYIGISNSATGTPGTVSIVAQGSDSNVDIRLAGRGTTGKIVIDTPGASSSEAATRSLFAPLAAIAFMGCMG